MANRYEQKCWYCGSHDLERLQDHIRCRSCGATWNKVPELQIPPTATVRYTVQDKIRLVHIKHLTPHAVITRRAAKAREAGSKLQGGH